MLVMVACVSNLSTQHRKLRQEDYEYLGQSGLQGGSKTNKQASLKYRKRLYLKQHQKKKRKKKRKTEWIYLDGTQGESICSNTSQALVQSSTAHKEESYHVVDSRCHKPTCLVVI